MDILQIASTGIWKIVSDKLFIQLLPMWKYEETTIIWQSLQSKCPMLVTCMKEIHQRNTEGPQKSLKFKLEIGKGSIDLIKFKT